MQLRLIFNFLVLICLTGGILAGCDLSVFAQNREQEKSKINDFGKSLREKDKSQSSEAPGESQNTEDVIKIETSLVRTDVLVSDQKGKAVLGLKKEDFIVTENNAAQEIGTFTLGDNPEVPRSIVLIIDYSSSQIPYINTSVDAAKILVDKLNPKDKMAIVTDDVELLLDFTNDKNLLKRKLDSLAERVKRQEVGKSLQYSALMAALNELFDTQDARPIVIFQTDGDQYADLKSANAVTRQLHSAGETSFTDNDLMQAIEKSRATIYSVISGVSYIGLTPEERLRKTEMVLKKQNPSISDHDAKNTWAKFVQTYFQSYSEPFFKAQTSMDVVARASGGFSENLETPDQADEIYTQILNSINNRYLIGYYPTTNQKRDGKRQNVKIEVRGHPEYTITGRKFYFAPQDKKTKGN